MAFARIGSILRRLMLCCPGVGRHVCTFGGRASGSLLSVVFAFWLLAVFGCRRVGLPE